MVLFRRKERKFTVKVNFTKEGSDSILIKNLAPGQTLLEVLLKHNVPVRYDCGGVCHCSTCHIYILKGEEFLEMQSIREKDFLKKVLKPMTASRLACQCLMLEGGGFIEILIP